MRRFSFLGLALTTLVFLTGLPAWAQHGHAPSHPSGPPASAPQGPGQSHGPGEPPGMGGEHGPSSSTGNASSHSQPTMGDLLTQNTKLSTRLQGLLPAGTDLQTAAAGFKNLGDFVAAVHVSHNLGIPFDELRGELVGPDAKKLGQAIHDLNPKVDSKAEAKKAKGQAKKTLKGTGASSKAS